MHVISENINGLIQFVVYNSGRLYSWLYKGGNNFFPNEFEFLGLPEIWITLDNYFYENATNLLCCKSS